MIEVRFMTLTGEPRRVRTETFDTLAKATAAVETHAAAGGFKNVRLVENECDGFHLRWTATTPGGRHGRNIAYADVGVVYADVGLEPESNWFELFYSDGGHGGPVVGEETAVAAAKRHLEYCRTTRLWVKVVNYRDWDERRVYDLPGKVISRDEPPDGCSCSRGGLAATCEHKDR